MEREIWPALRRSDYDYEQAGVLFKAAIESERYRYIDDYRKESQRESRRDIEPKRRRE